MKIRHWFFLGCLTCAVLPLACYAEPASDIIEQFATGSINWTRGVVSATGRSLPQNPSAQAEQAQEYDEAYQRAVENLRVTLTHLRMNHNHHMVDLLSAQVSAGIKVKEMTSGAKIVTTAHEPGAAIEVKLEMNLYGGFSQLMLPPDIRQVESIRPLKANRPANSDAKQDLPDKAQEAAPEPNAYSGLLVDARGIGASPSMVPILMDENEQEVYGPNFVSREFAVQHGMCRYVRAPVDSPALQRIAPNPLLVKGLRTITPGSCDIMISNSDASKLRGVSSHLEVLKQCRVVIIID